MPNSKKQVAIIGTVGIPAVYGGFETLVEYLTQQLGKRLQFTVYCSSNAYSEKVDIYNNSKLKYIPLKGNGVQSIPYDIISLFKAAKEHQTILILGVSGCIVLPIFRIFYKRKRIIINIDGLEHRREKWNIFIKSFLKYSEKLAVKHADEIIADNKAIQKYVRDEYGIKSIFIPYAGDQVRHLKLSQKIKQKYSLPDKYAFKVCRIEPENNIDLILEAFTKVSLPIVIIGNWSNNIYGKELKKQFKDRKNFYLLDPIYDQVILNQIRSNCAIYLHGHSAGGTNPALIEAMNLGLPVYTFDCAYNRETTLNKAIYFKNVTELIELIQYTSKETLIALGETMLKIANERYTWELISDEYYNLLK